MNPTYKKIAIISTTIAILVLVWFVFIRKKQKPVILQTVKPTHGHISQSVTATGRIQPVDTVNVGTQISGIIKSVYADFNSQVKKGQLIAELDKSLLQATLDQVKGNLMNNRSTLLYQQGNYYRQSLLYKTDATSKADYDLALSNYKAAKAAVSSAEAQVRLAAKNLSYAEIHSPINGVILNRNISPGQTVAASFSTPTLFIIARDITKMQVEANVDEADIGDVKPGERVTFTVDAFVNDEFEGTVKEIRLHPAVSSNVVTYTTIISAPNEDKKLKPGMTANITIYTKEVDHAMLIPVKALKFTPDSALMKDYVIQNESKRRSDSTMATTEPKTKSELSVKSRKAEATRQEATVWILHDKTLIKKQIYIGLNDNIQVQVLSGLSEQDNIVTGLPDTAGVARASTQGGSPFIPTRRRGGSGGNR